MKLIIIKRVVQNNDGTFGIVLDELVPFCLSLERQWKDNKVGESCIPKGEYIANRVTSEKFGKTFEVIDVPGRTAILIHKGNIDADTHGCIILGEMFGILGEKTAVLSSGMAFEEFMLRLNGEISFKLIIE